MLGRWSREVLGEAEQACGSCRCRSVCKISMSWTIRLSALEMTSLSILTEADQGGQIGAEPSMLKLKGSQLVQDHGQRCCSEIIGNWVLPLDSVGLESGSRWVRTMRSTWPPGSSTIAATPLPAVPARCSTTSLPSRCSGL